MKRDRQKWLVGAGLLAMASWPALADAQQPDPLRINPATVVVTAQKEPEEIQKLPVSVTAVPKEVLSRADITTVADASVYAPNTFFSEFQARKLSFPHFRGISSGPGNPAITTYVDGVPQLHTNASSIELIDVEQVELVRGAQSALFGRNALGGIINVASTRPSLSTWTGNATIPLGNFGSKGIRGAVSGPLSDRLAVSVAAGRSVRDGFTRNDVGGGDLDYRGSSFGKAQLLWTPAANWETRLIVHGERARDGDYALNDLGELRRNPFHASRDFEGRTERDVVSTTLVTRREGSRTTLSTTTGVVRWRAMDETDLDYSPFPLLTRTNDEEATQFSQEVRLASAANAPWRVSDAAALRWQAGVFLFTQGYKQDAVNTSSPFLSPLLPFSVSQHSPLSTLDDLGVGLYGQGTATLRERLDVSLGVRVDHEQKDATLETFAEPAIVAPTRVVGDEGFSSVSPQLSVSYRVRPERMIYASVGRGFKAGGFNPASPIGSEAYGEEQTWQTEGGVKTTWAGGRLTATAAVFHINWDDLQLNLPNQDVQAQFYIANVGGAQSSGAELELQGRPHDAVSLFATVGVTRARFKEGSVSSGVDVSDNELPGTPAHTMALGGNYSRPLNAAATLFAGGEVVVHGSFEYDDANTAGQEAYSLTNLRAGLRGKRLVGELWIRNAFDTRYIPIAFAYPGLARSGFVGEMGRPRTFGASLGVTF